MKLNFKKYFNSFILFLLPGKEIFSSELRTWICSYLTIYRSKGRPPVSDGGSTCNSIVFEPGFITGIRGCSGGTARRRVMKCLSIRELSARHSNFDLKSSSNGLY